MIFRHSSPKNSLLSWPGWFAFLLILTSCASLSGVGSQGAAPTPTATHASTSTPGDPPASAIPTLSGVIDTWNNVHIFQTFDYHISNPMTIASHYDFIWGAQAGNVAGYRAGNAHTSISFYMPFDRDWGTFPDSSTYHSLTWWQANHPDWILYRCDRVTPAYTTGYPNVPLDFTNPAVLSWQIQTYAQPASSNGYNAIAVDNIVFPNFFGACGVYKNGQWVQRYSGQQDDSQWRADIISWVKQMQQALHSLPHPLALISNFYVGSVPFTDPQLQQLANYSDGLLDEDGFTLSGRGYLIDSNWLQRVQFMQRVQQLGKPYYVIDLFPSVHRAQVQWSLASYLMGKEHSAALFIASIGGYGSTHLYSEYAAQIGSPSDALYQAQNVYWRDYSNGLTLINPSSTSTYTVNLNPKNHYVDLYGDPVASKLKMPPHSGIVLLLQP